MPLVDRSKDLLLSAGPGFKVEMSGVGWKGDFKLSNGTPVLRSGMSADDPRRMIADLPLDADAPGVPGYAVYATEAFDRLGVKNVYYTPALIDVDLQALQDGFRQFEIEQMNAMANEVASSFQQINDHRVVAGSYDRFNAIGDAFSAGRYGDVWRHMTFEASDQAREAATQRLFPPQNLSLARIDRMASSPIGASVSTIARLLGAGQQTQDALLATGGLAEQIAGARTGVYRQTLTAPPPMPGTPATGGRRVIQPLPPVPGANPTPKRGVIEFQGLEVRAVRDLGHVDVRTLRAMQQYGFAGKDMNGNSLVLHHHRQDPTGPIIEMPAANHSIGNPRQHPFGNTKGAGLTSEQRADFDQWRVEYWKWRATQELVNRGLQ